jgi:CDP-paratose synthetase
VGTGKRSLENLVTLKILLTGATGFLGSHLLFALLDKQYQIVIVKRSFSSSLNIDEFLKRVTAYNLDSVTLNDIFRKEKYFDAVIHLATEYGREQDSLQRIVSTNICFSLELLQLSIQYKTPLWINTGTFFPKNYNYYALSKAQFFEWGRQLIKGNETHFVNLVLHHMIGPKDSDTKFSMYVVNNCLSNTKELALTSGLQKRDFINVLDVVNVYSLLLSHKWLGKNHIHEFDVGTGQMTTIRQFVEMVHTLSKSNTLLKFGVVPQTEREIMVAKADIRPLSFLGWKPQFSLEQTIKQIIKQAKEK